VLGNSLSAGILSADGTDYTKPSGEGGSEQVFEVEPGTIIIGTSVPYAEEHHNGRFPLWPDPQDFPTEWWDSVADVMVDMLPNVIGIIAAMAREG